LALETLRKNKIQCRKLMGCIPDYPFFNITNPDWAFVNARKFADTGLFVPVHQNLKKEEIERTCEILLSIGR
jgi:dTDP-4-amino-4,6-dideoxygalactose transaminase